MRHALATLLVLVSVGCRPGPIIDTTPGPDNPQATISGRLQKSGNGGAVAGRQVRAVDVVSGRAFDATTNPAGGFTIQLPPSTYRLEVQTLDGEHLHDPPGDITVGPSDIDANITITVGPRTPGS